MPVLTLFEDSGVQASRRSVVVIEDVLDFTQGNAELIERAGRGVPGHMRLAGPEMFHIDLFNGLDRQLCAAAAVVGKGNPHRMLLLLEPVRAVEVLEVLNKRTSRLHFQERVTAFRALRPREVDREPVADPGEIANMHAGQCPAALCRLERDAEECVVAFPRRLGAVDPDQQLAHLDHLDGLRTSVGMDRAAFDVINRIVALVEALLFGILDQAGDRGQPMIIGRGRDLAGMLRGGGAASCPLLHDEEIASEHRVVGEIHQQVKAVFMQHGAQRERRGVIGDMGFPTLRLARFGVEPGEEYPIIWQADQLGAVVDRAVVHP